MHKYLCWITTTHHFISDLSVRHHLGESRKDVTAKESSLGCGGKLASDLSKKRILIIMGEEDHKAEINNGQEVVHILTWCKLT